MWQQTCRAALAQLCWPGKVGQESCTTWVVHLSHPESPLQCVTRVQTGAALVDCSAEWSIPWEFKLTPNSAGVISVHLSISPQVSLPFFLLTIFFSFSATCSHSCLHILLKHALSPSRGFNHLTFVQNPARFRTSPWTVHAPPILSSWTGPIPLVCSFTPSQSWETWATRLPSRAPCPASRWTFPVVRATLLVSWGRIISVTVSQAPPPSIQLVHHDCFVHIISLHVHLL